MNANRLDDNTTRLSRQMSHDVMNKSNIKTNEIGKETKSMINKISNKISEALAQFNLSRYVKGSAVTTSQPPLK